VTTQPTLTPATFAQKWRGVTTTEKASAAVPLHRPVPAARRADAPWRRSHGKRVRLRETRHESRERGGLRRRLEARLLRLGIQGQVHARQLLPGRGRCREAVALPAVHVARGDLARIA